MRAHRERDMDRQAILQVFTHGKPVIVVVGGNGPEFPGIIDGIPWNSLGDTTASPDVVLVEIRNPEDRRDLAKLRHRYAIFERKFAVPISHLRVKN